MARGKKHTKIVSGRKGHHKGGRKHRGRKGGRKR